MRAGEPDSFGPVGRAGLGEDPADVGLDRVAASNAVTVDALTDGLLLMALAMTLTRTLGLVGRAARLPARTAAAPHGVPTGTRGG